MLENLERQGELKLDELRWDGVGGGLVLGGIGSMWLELIAC